LLPENCLALGGTIIYQAEEEFPKEVLKQLAATNMVL
jgi:hypothetical protein